MPDALPRLCNKPNCPRLKRPGRSYCKEHEREWAAEDRKRRGSAAKQGYGRQHQRLRLLVLHRDPICKMCGVRPSTVLDHIVPVKEHGPRWDVTNLQGVCVNCHNQKSGREGMRRMRERMG